MKIIIISNLITPHQVPLCESLVGIEEVELLFIETHHIDKSKLPIGWRFLGSKDYVIDYYKFLNEENYYRNEILNADVVIWGSASIHFVQSRLDAGKLVFLYSERIYKNWKECLKMIFHYWKFSKMYRHYDNLLLQCAGAFTASDYSRLGLFKNKAYKWGYFTPTNIELPATPNRFKTPLKLLWCSRFIDWKHPELALQLSKRLRDNGYEFSLDMIGDGQMVSKMRDYVKRKGLSDHVHFLGTMSNSHVHEQMRQHDIFLFTSDKGEGWGAVANEAMANGCVLVCSDEIGSVPYLVTHRGNGIIFKSRDLNSLYKEIIPLFEDDKLCMRLSYNAIATMNEVWSPYNAAKSLIRLSRSLINKEASTILNGPCSKA